MKTAFIVLISLSLIGFNGLVYATDSNQTKIRQTALIKVTDHIAENFVNEIIKEIV